MLSIRDGRATIGVQQPQADPHIEAFDNDDLFDLARHLPAVVGRAQARWEEQPMHRAYDRPAPPRRPRNRRRGAANPPTETGTGETEQQQTLQLF